MNAVDATLAALLRGEARAAAGDAGALLARAHLHGVDALLHETLESGPRGVGDAVRAPLRERALRAAALELGHASELRRLLELMARAGVRPILLKGTPLAYTAYRRPALRPRGDTDLLVRPAQREALFALLQSEGYRRGEDTGSETASGEASFHKAGSPLVLDVHWRIRSSPLLAGVLQFDELEQRAVAVPALGPHARAPGAVDAVLLAAIHRAAHFQSPYYAGDSVHRGDRLIWLYDLHLLVPHLSAAERTELARRAAEHRIAGLCLDALRAAQEAFGTPLPEPLEAGLARAAGRPEASMVFLRGGRRQLLLAELRAIRGWRRRLGWLRAHAFPPADYMLRKYRTRRRWLLPALYLRRALGWLAR